MGNASKRFYVHLSEHNLAFRLENNTIQAVPNSEIQRQCDCSVGILHDKELISYAFDAEQGLPKEEMDDTLEIRMFQDAGLNPLIDYKIAYRSRRSPLSSKELSVNAFATDPTHFAHAFQDVKKSICIDAALPLSTLPHALYEADVLEKKSDIYLYMREEESILAFFYQGEYLYAKTLTTGLKNLYDRFVQNSTEALTYDTFIRVLTGRGIDPSRYTTETTDERRGRDIFPLLEKLLFEALTVIGYAKRMNGIEGFERLFFGTSRGTLPGSRTLIKETTGIEGFDFEFFTDFYQQGDPYIDQSVILSMIEADNRTAGRGTNPFNLTLYPRPPRFTRRISGRFLSVTAASIIMALLYPGYLFFDALWQENRYKAISDTLQISRKAYMDLKAGEDALKSEQTRYKTILNEEQAKLQSSVDLLRNIAAKRDKIGNTSTILATLFNHLNANTVQIRSLELSNNRYTLTLRAKEESDLTAFVRAVSKKKNFLVDMDGFSFDKTNQTYGATVIIGMQA